MKLYLLTCFCVLSLSCGYSQNIYHKDTLTILADSLHINGDYQQAISVRKQAIKTQIKAPVDYQAYLKAKYFHTNSANFEQKSYDYHNPDKAITKKAREQYLDSALQSATEARDLYIKVKHPDRIFQYQLQNRIYHQTAYLGNWKQALEQAELGYKFLKDTLTRNDKTFVDLIYDIGFIYSKLGDYSKSVDNYQKSLDLYKNIIGENHTDVAQAYNNIAVEYRNLGLHKKELESLLKAKTIWEQLNIDNDKQFLYRCYGNLFFWYSYYGDFDKAEEYILKKNNLRKSVIAKSENGFLRNKEEIYEDKLSEWHDLMLHYSRKKDTVKTILYAENILKTINSDKKLLNFEAKTLSATLKFYASLKNKTNSDAALLLLDKAIEIQEKYKEVFYTKPFYFKLYKVELLLKSKKYADAAFLLSDLNKLNESEEISNKFKLAILNAKTAQALHKSENAKTHFDRALLLLKVSHVPIEQLTIKDLKPVFSFETIDGFLAMGDFYLESYTKTHVKIEFKKAILRYLLASKIYNQLYLGERYNDQLFYTNLAINTRLLNAYFQFSEDKKLLKDILNTIENNSSKFTWSKFIYNNKRQLLNIPKSLVNEEEDVKAQLNFYQNALINSEGVSEEKITLWKDKIYELKNAFSKIQDSIKEQNKSYYQLNTVDFDVSNLQVALKTNEVVLKYVFTENELYAFLITKNSIELVSKTNKKNVLKSLKICLNSLKTRSKNYQNSFDELRGLLFNQIPLQNFKKLTIIPDGALHYFPFESLILEKNMPIVSYASSLLLFQEQKAINSNSGTFKIAAFSVSNSNSKLPKASVEVKSILKYFEGSAFINATKNNFLKLSNQFNILHLAMHTNINEVYPEFSSLNFYGETDNKLFISELYNDSFKANMVVLSACDTGNGFYENGEGVISLSRAFNYAGVPCTVMSLWKVDDEATATIMTFFYKHLSQGETKDEALKNAKLDYLNAIEDPLLKHPYYWSGFVVTGNTDALVETTNYWWSLLLMPFVIVGVFRKRLFQFFKKGF